MYTYLAYSSAVVLRAHKTRVKQDPIVLVLVSRRVFVSTLWHQHINIALL